MILSDKCKSRFKSAPSAKSLLDRCKDDWPGALEVEFQKLSSLKSCQIQALENVRHRCRQLHLSALPTLRKRARDLGFSTDELNSALTWMRDHAPIIIHINLETTGYLLANDSHYRNQFETSTSGGTLDPSKR